LVIQVLESGNGSQIFSGNIYKVSRGYNGLREKF